MAEQVTLMIPDTLVTLVREAASLSHRNVEEILLEWLERGQAQPEIAHLPDAQVIRLCDLEMAAADQAQMSELLDRHREGALGAIETEQLEGLLQAYRRGMVRKAEAWKALG
jgi:hypothetical protein